LSQGWPAASLPLLHPGRYATIRIQGGIAFASARRNMPPMQSHELLKEVLKKTSAKQISAEMGLSLSLIYKWAEPPVDETGSGANNPLDRIEQLLRITNDERIAQWVCERSGGFFVANPKVKPQHYQLIPSTNSIVQEFADMLGVIAVAASDNAISKDEAKAIRRRWEDLKSVTEGFVRNCEEGNFGAIKESSARPAI
jgi:hypothetical protein